MEGRKSFLGLGWGNGHRGDHLRPGLWSLLRLQPQRRPQWDPRRTVAPHCENLFTGLPWWGKASIENELGQYIPVAVPDTTTYPGSDYYEISIHEKHRADAP